MRIPSLNLIFVGLYGALDAVPGPNFVTNAIINPITKIVLFSLALLNRPVDISESAFLSHVYKKSMAKQVFLSVPVLGYIGVAIYDRVKSKGKSEVTEETHEASEVSKNEAVVETKREDIALKKEAAGEPQSLPKNDAAKPKGKEKDDPKSSTSEQVAEKNETKSSTILSTPLSKPPRDFTSEIKIMFLEKWQLSGPQFILVCQVWSSIFGNTAIKELEIDSSKPLEDNQYKVTLENGLMGESSKLKIAGLSLVKFKISKDLTLSFTTEGNKKILTFHSYITTSLSSTKTIAIEEDYVTVTTTVGGSTWWNSYTMNSRVSYDLTLEILNSIKWTKVD